MSKAYTPKYLTAAQVKRKKVGTDLCLVRASKPTDRIRGWLVKSGNRKMFKAFLTDNLYEIRDRDGWLWMEVTGS